MDYSRIEKNSLKLSHLCKDTGGTPDITIVGIIYYNRRFFLYLLSIQSEFPKAHSLFLAAESVSIKNLH
jgi:hypothetical protein